jgi:hypothetical protein
LSNAIACQNGKLDYIIFGDKISVAWIGYCCWNTTIGRVEEINVNACVIVGSTKMAFLSHTKKGSVL